MLQRQRFYGKFCKDLGEHAMSIVNFGKKEMIITDEESKFYEG